MTKAKWIPCVLAATMLLAQSAASAGERTGRPGKICARNETGQTLYFILRQDGAGLMRGKVTPNSRFCTSSYTDAMLSVSIIKRGEEFCPINAVSGVQYNLVKLTDYGDCIWE